MCKWVGEMCGRGGVPACAFPPSESLRTMVRVELRYGTWAFFATPAPAPEGPLLAWLPFRSPRHLITSPSTLSDRLMLDASRSRVPWAPVARLGLYDRMC